MAMNVMYITRQSWYPVHRVTRADFEKKVEERRKFEMLESGGRLELLELEKTAFKQKASERSTGKRALQAAAVNRIEVDMEQSIAKVCSNKFTAINIS